MTIASVCSARPERQFRPRAELVAQRPPHVLGLREAGAGQRGMRRIALQPVRGVEHGFAVASDEIAAEPRRKLGCHAGVFGPRGGPRATAFSPAPRWEQPPVDSTPCGAKTTDFRVYLRFMQSAAEAPK